MLMFIALIKIPFTFPSFWRDVVVVVVVVVVAAVGVVAGAIPVAAVLMTVKMLVKI